jgi:hypothetical protein
MILNEKDAVYTANYFIDYFSNLTRIDDYFRRIKIEKMKDYPSSLPGMGMRDYFFDDFTVHPSEMKILMRQNDALHDDLLELTASHVVERSVPGRTMKITVYEENTMGVIGFIRLSSCAINLKPRNDWLESPLDTTDMAKMQKFNHTSVMGQIIVPAQPFGFNYLGGKLLAALCCSHEIREMFDRKYNTEICHFETTSLYGSTKTSSQYDGMKPYLRFKGLTESDFVPLMTEDCLKEMRTLFRAANGNKDLVNRYSASNPTSPKPSLKLSTQNMMISIIKKSLKEHGQIALLLSFNDVIRSSKDLNEHKRVYFGDYGYENSREYLLGKDDSLMRGVNFDRHYQENVVSWWKKLASKRYDKLKSEARLRPDLELWNETTDIEIIR